MKREKWLPVVGFEEFYEVSDWGRVRSLPCWTLVRGGGYRPRPGIILKPFPVGKGHLAVALGRGNKRKVHLLVLEAHVGPRPKGLLGLHNDGDVTNNRRSNLRWDTYSANNLDSVKHGTHYSASKTECPYGHPLDGVVHKSDGSVKGRYCKTCHNEDNQRRKRRQKALNPPLCQMPDCKKPKTPGQANQYCEECREKAKERRKQRARERTAEWHRKNKMKT